MSELLPCPFCGNKNLEMGMSGNQDREGYPVFVLCEKPYICPEHPQAQIRLSWDQTHYVLNGYPAGHGLRSGHKYECAECGRELSAEPLRKP